MIRAEFEVASASRHAAVRADPVIVRAVRDIRRLYGDRVVRILLFGSRARGEERPGSDYDIAVFLKDYDWSWDEVGRLADLTFDILMETYADVSFFPIPVEESVPCRLFTFNILEEGVELWVRSDQPQRQ